MASTSRFRLHHYETLLRWFDFLGTEGKTYTLPAVDDTLVGVAGGMPAAGGFTASPRLVHSGGNPATVSTDGTDATPSTTETYIVEIFVPCNMTATGVAIFNGSNVTGNRTIGLADSTGAPMTGAKSASTAGSGTDAYQLVPFAAPINLVGPATYFVQVQFSSATARFNTHTVGSFGASKQTGQTYGTFASFTPPTTFTTGLGPICSLY